jgi:DNA replication protein DnaC
MLNQVTLDKMQAMKLSAMAEAFEHQAAARQAAGLSFEERLGLLIDAEWTHREQRKLTRRLRGAKLRYSACLEDVNFRAPRGLDRQVVLSLGTCGWIQEHHNLVLTGPTGTGKSFFACAFVERACRQGFTAVYVRASRILQELAVARGDGSYERLLTRLLKADLLAIDDWLVAPLRDAERRDLLEILEDRHERASTLIASQLPISAWHEAIGEPTLADGIVDRLLHRAHRIQLTGPSLRDTEPPTSTSTTEKKLTKSKTKSS